MILAAKNCEFNLPESVDPHSLTLGIWSDGDPDENPQSYLKQLEMVPLNGLVKMRAVDAKVGEPTLFAVRHGFPDALLFFPTPDKDYHARLRYNPAAKEI